MARSPLHDLHRQLGARFVDFGGWEMPVQYQSVLAEHRAVREGVGWFDVSHLGRFLWEGAGAREALRWLLANDVDLIEPGRTQYSLLLNQEGGIEDDLLVWRWEEDSFWVLPNASTHSKVLDRFRAQAPGAVSDDLRTQTAMVAIQGPAAPAILETVLGVAPKRFRTYRLALGGSPLWLGGTGYTGERGGEVVTDPETAAAFVAALQGEGVVACGLGARDTLRLEAGLLLAGQDFDSSTTPLEAGLEFAVSWDHEFCGKEALEIARGAGVSWQIGGFVLEGRSIPRPGHRLRAGDSEGSVTSGNFSPMLGLGIGLGYLGPPTDTDPEVEIRGVWEKARHTELPFYKR